MRKIREEQGASAVEFAIVSSVLFLVLFGTIQFGIAFNRYQGVQAAAREGARIASFQDTTQDQILARVQSSVSIVNGASISSGCPGTLANDTGCVSTTPSGSGSFKPCLNRSGQTVAVTVKYQTLISIPLWSSPTVTLTGKGEFLCE